MMTIKIITNTCTGSGCQWLVAGLQQYNFIKGLQVQATATAAHVETGAPAACEIT